MEKIKFGETVVLSNDKEYVCFGELFDNEIDYVYLISNSTPVEVLFARQENINDDVKLTIVSDKDEKNRVLELFRENMSRNGSLKQ